MTELRFETLTMPAADLGPENPLPSMKNNFKPRCNLPAYEFRIGSLPHRLQDGYNRIRKPRDFNAVVLENEYLRATFLPELGGRLWSLLHKPTGRDLLEVNPVFQPCNLGIRNAWISGGVEWNIGVLGHTVYNVSPIFAARLQMDDGTPVLRMYEWCRNRLTPYQMDAFLPSGSQFLFFRVRITNPLDQEVPMYWWSNITVSETPGLRVLAPTSECRTFDRDKQLVTWPIPYIEGQDRSYPTNAPNSGEWFFNLPEGNRPWVAALDEEGYGLIHASSSKLKGRKFWFWGMGPGGRRFQQYLSVEGRTYIEIQGGITAMQIETLPMPGKSELEWVEAYGLMQGEKNTVHSSDFPTAYNHVQHKLDEALPQQQLEDLLKATRLMSDRPVQEIIRHGQGWGALENRRRQKAGLPPMCSQSLSYTEQSMQEDQKPWLALLETGKLPETDPSQEPGCFQTQPEWRQLLEESINKGLSDHWLGWLHLGVMLNEAGDSDGARKAFEKSLRHKESAWAYRNLAVIADNESKLEESADYYLKAVTMMPSVTRLLMEACRRLVDVRPREVCELAASLPLHLQKMGRIQIVWAKAALKLGDLQTVERILLDESIVYLDVREGEVSLTDAWFELHEKKLAIKEGKAVDDDIKQRVQLEFPPPARIDFRMRVVPPAPAKK